LLPALPLAPALPVVELPPVPVPVDSVGPQPRASRPRDQITTFVAFMASPVVGPWRNGSRALWKRFSQVPVIARDPPGDVGPEISATRRRSYLPTASARRLR
jgi:hypothetical protein